MDSENYRKKILQEVLKIIKKNLQKTAINAGRARELARYILANLPKGIPTQQIYTLVPFFGESYPELAPLSMAVSNDHENSLRDQIVPQIETLIKEGKIKEANALMSSHYLQTGGK